MSQPRKPAYRCQRDPKGDRAFVQLGGQRVYLGPFDSPKSRSEYARVVAEWLATGTSPRHADGGLTIIELVDVFSDHVAKYYRDVEGNPTTEVDNFKVALRTIKMLYGSLPAAEFGPRCLMTVREAMIANTDSRQKTGGRRRWSRRYVNKQIQRTRAMFAWAVSRELIPETVHRALQTVKGLRRGRTTAPESEPVRPVDEEIVERTIAHTTSVVGAMIRLQQLTGMRPGEVVRMTTGELDTTGAVWTYTPAKHKTAWRGTVRTVYIGPKAQDVLRPFLRKELGAFIFSPKASEAERHARMQAERVTPASCGNGPGKNRKRHPRKRPAECYSVATYRQAIEYACVQAWPVPDEVRGVEAVRAWNRDHRWHPNQLRHTFATRVRRDHGLEAAQVLLGHAAADVTQVYAQRDEGRARAVAVKIG